MEHAPHLLAIRVKVFDGEGGSFLQVGTDTKSLVALGAQQHDPDIRSRAHLSKRGGKLLRQTARDRVERFCSSQRDDSYLAVRLERHHRRAHTGGTPCRRLENERSFPSAHIRRRASSARRSSGCTTESITFSEARCNRSMSASYSSRLSAMKRARSSGSSIDWILLKYTALIAGSGPITAIRAVGSAIVTSGSKPGPA